VGKLSVSAPIQPERNSPLYYYTRYQAFPSIGMSLGMSEFPEERLPGGVRTLLRVGALYGCRIAELLAVEVGNVAPCDRVFVKGAKGSGSYMLYLPGVSEAVEGAGEQAAGNRLWGLPYSAVYRYCGRIGLRVSRGRRQQGKVTHAARYRIAELAAKHLREGKPGDMLHHRSERSIRYYLN
jgi:hypothetical protein